MKKTPALLNTSMLLVAAQALAASAAQVPDGTVIDANALKAKAEHEAAMKEWIAVALNKRPVQKAMAETHRAVSTKFGRGKQSMSSKHYGDLVGRIKNASAAPSNVDSTTLGSTDFTPSKVGSQEYSDGLSGTCHGACHGVLSLAQLLRAGDKTSCWYLLRIARMEVVPSENGLLLVH